MPRANRLKSNGMVLTAGGPCVGQQKRRRHEGDDEPDQPCGAVTSHKWYSGPMCKNCYRRNNTERRKQSKMAKTEDARTESGGDIPLVCLRVSAARCALPPIAPALSPPGHCLLAPATCAVGTQVIGRPTGAGGPEQPAA